MARGRPGQPANPPPRGVVLTVATEEAGRAGASLTAVLGATQHRNALRARKAAWLRVLAETGCSMRGLARVWGADARSVRRAVAERRLEIGS